MAARSTVEGGSMVGRSAASRGASVGGGLAYRRFGSGEPLVLLHGLGSAGSFWAPIVPKLAEGFEVIVVDLPGHGRSPEADPGHATPAALAAQVARTLGDAGMIDEQRRPHVVGLSLGGWVALELAARGAARSVTVLAPAGVWRKPPVVNPLRTQGTTGRILRATRPVLPALARLGPVRTAALATLSARPGEISAEQFLGGMRALAHAKGYGPLYAAMVGASFEHAGQISRDVPVSVAFGDRDMAIGPPRHQDRARLPAHATVEIFSRCGHAVTWDQPDPSITLIVSTAGRARPAE